MLDNEKDFIATRIAYKLNLTGPAISIHTAGSTSLVAVCQAMDSLRLGQCDMALAGGITVTCPPRSGYLHQEGAMLSPDGHTRTFDAHAQGTAFSDGAAIVLLKRLSDAVADGDQVYAVILGGAVNNDGAGKASFTAPSSDGQAAVIAIGVRETGEREVIGLAAAAERAVENNKTFKGNNLNISVIFFVVMQVLWVQLRYNIPQPSTASQIASLGLSGLALSKALS